MSEFENNFRNIVNICNFLWKQLKILHRKYYNRLL